MSIALTIAGRELRSAFCTAGAYVVTALFLLFTGLLYFMYGALLGGGFNQGEPASMRLLFFFSTCLFLLIAPAVSMRTISEELRLGTLEALMTAPVGEGQLVLGKYLGALAFLVVMLAPTGLYVVAMELYGRPDYGELLCGYAGLVLAGSAFLASGILASALTSSQVVAYMITVMFWLCLLLATLGLPSLLSVAEEALGQADRGPLAHAVLDAVRVGGEVMAMAEPFSRLQRFAEGLLDSANVVYFVSITIVFLLAAAKALELRRCA